MRNPANLNPRAILSQAIAQFAFDRTIVPLLVHVDEIDHDQAGEVPQAKLPCDFLGSLEIGLKRGIFDVMFARRAAGVNIDRDQRLGLVDDDIPARSQLNGR